MYRHNRVLLFTGLFYLGQDFNDGLLLGTFTFPWSETCRPQPGQPEVSWGYFLPSAHGCIQGHLLVFKHIPLHLQVQTVIRWWSIFFDSKYVPISRIITLFVQGTFSGTLALAEAFAYIPICLPSQQTKVVFLHWAWEWTVTDLHMISPCWSSIPTCQQKLQLVISLLSLRSNQTFVPEHRTLETSLFWSLSMFMAVAEPKGKPVSVF